MHVIFKHSPHGTRDPPSLISLSSCGQPRLWSDSAEAKSHLSFRWAHVILLLLLSSCFTALRHFSCHFERDQFTYPHHSWASRLGSLPVLSAYFFRRRGQNGRRNVFMTKARRKNVLLDVRIEPATNRIPGGRAFDRATAPDICCFCRAKAHICIINCLWH